MGELDISTADDTYLLDDLIGILLKAILKSLVYGEHRCSAERISRVDTHSVNVFNKAHRNHPVF